MVQPTVASYRSLAESDCYSYAHLIVPSNTVDLNSPTRELYIGGTGTLALAMVGDNGFATSQTFTAADLTANTMFALNHGMLDGQILVVTAGTTPLAGLAVNTLYYVVSTDLAAHTFKLSATVGGAAIDITDTGTGVQTMHRISAVHTALPVAHKMKVRANRIFATGTSATLIIAYW